MLPASMHYTTRREVPGSIPGRGLGNFQVTYSFMSKLSRLGVYTASDRKKVSRSLLGGKERPARGADSSAVRVVSNVKVRFEVQNSIPPPWVFMTCYLLPALVLKIPREGIPTLT
jgi:hypothetical protein